MSLIECASDSSYDNVAAVQRVLAGELPGQNPPPITKAHHAESKNERDIGYGSKSQVDDDGAKSGIIESKSRGDVEMLSERGKSRGGTRGGKPQTSSSDMGLQGSITINLDPEIERCDGTEGTTQTLLGELITRPKLSEKLLSKPPFRFLHDIIMEIIKVTGFATGLYTTTEMDSSLVTDKNQKLVFLEKIIKVVGIQLNTLVQAKPAKIVAGLDVQNTNNFLQLLAVCAKHSPDSKLAVRTVLEQMGTEGGELTSETASSNNERYQEKNIEPKAIQKSEPKEEITGKFDEKNDTMADDRQNNTDADDSEVKRSARPTTARRRPPKVKDGAKEVGGRDLAPAPKKIEGILIDGQNDDDDEIVATETRLTDEMKSDFKSDKTKESKLVQDIRGRQAEQEAAIAAPVKEQSEEKTTDSTNSSGIRLGRLRKTGAEKKSVGPSISVISAPLSDGDIEKLRSAIQILVQHTGPLGTCMDYIQEDIGMMTAELHKWEDDCRKYESEVEIEIRKSQETLHPLRMEQHDLNDQITEQIARISSIKAQIARNDDRIQQILKLVVNS